MNVHFDCAPPVVVTDLDRYKKMINMIKELGHNVVNVWNENLYTEGEHRSPGLEDFEALCARTVDSLLRADVVILDVQEKGLFGLGYQTALALQAEKPTLLLRFADVRGSFVDGLRHPLLTHICYDDDLESSLGWFFRKVQV